ncbi:MAG: primosomal protein N' [Nitrospirales bacterium]|nr:primosomal protein N' [Nitrospirales bacterium]
MFVDVVLPSRQYRVFTYRVPPRFQRQVQVGCAVVVPLGTIVVTGVVVSREQTVPNTSGLGIRPQMYRDVISVDMGMADQPLSPILMQLIRTVASYYLAPISSCLPLIIPPREVKVKSRVFLTDEGRRVLAEDVLSMKDSSLLRSLERRPKGLLRTTWDRSATVNATTVARLKKNGWVEERPMIRSSSDGGSSRKVHTIMAEQRNPLTGESAISEKRETVEFPPGFENMLQALNQRIFQERLCVASEEFHWAGLMKAVMRVFANKRRALILAPETQDVEALAVRCRRMWGKRVGIFHGGLPHSMKVAEWECIRRGERDVVVGTRSALFLPLPDVGLIWIEREADASYKEEHVPYYHAREVARMRAELECALVVYSSSLPSLEIYARFQHDWTFLKPARSVSSPILKMVDMRQVAFGNILSPPLEEKIAQTLARREPVILFLNRKGFSHGLLCKDCGHVPVCSVCHVTLKFFQRPPKLLCSYCGRTQTTPEVCAVCQGTVFRFTGVGTQRLEDEVARMFPSAKVARFDREQVKTRQEADGILAAFQRGEIQLLIGTEWLFHRVDSPKAALLGFPQADLGLHIPDFRSAERTYRTLAQAVRMADRGANPGEVILQTWMREHHVLQAIGKQDPERFYGPELSLRKLLGYPPFSHLLLIVITGSQSAKVQPVVEFFKNRFERLFQAETEAEPVVEMVSNDGVLGPIHSKKAGSLKKKRTLFLIKTMRLPVVQQQMRILQQEYHQRFPSLPVVVEIHVDPLEIH